MLAIAVLSCIAQPATAGSRSDTTAAEAITLYKGENRDRAFSLTGGQVHDITQAETLTAKIQAEALLADKGYNSDKYVASLEFARSSRLSRPKRIAMSNAIAISPSTPSAIWLNNSSNSSHNSEV